MTESKTTLKKILFAFLAIGMMTACSNEEPKAADAEDSTMEPSEETTEVIIEEYDWIILEDGFGSDGEDKVSLTETKPAEEGEAAATVMEPISHDEFAERISPVVYIEPAPIEVEITETIIPVLETETVTAYNSKGKEKGRIEVVHNSQSGEIVSVSYTHKGHKDEYGAQPGMSAKEVKKLRKDMKHMMHRGKYYLYSDVSNVMYVLDAKDNMGNEITEMEMDEYVVQAIVWKDKKHHTDMAEVTFLSE
ncbi:hypothetical protein O3Q51_09325 [Cryomorphaceae bacterium 1068]|nr:hypothetical protein [Cryomorphaceae bacterium 1068]